MVTENIDILNDLYSYTFFSISKSHSQNLNDYTQKLFDNHENVQKILKNQLKIRLNIAVIEAQDLILKYKTCNPYCIVYLLNENKNLKPQIRSTNSSPQLVSSNGSPIVKRCESLKRALSKPDDILMKTNVFFDTRNPIWNETRQIDLQDLNDCKLFIQVYDSMDNRFLSPSLDASDSNNSQSSKKNSLKDHLKSFRRRSIRTTDYLLGQLMLSLKDIHEHNDDWYKLVCKHNDNTHKTRGRIHLKLEFLILENKLNRPDIIQNEHIINESLIEKYYHLSKLIYKKNLLSLTSKNKWNGILNPLAKELIKCYCDSYYIKRSTIKLFEIVCLMELYSDCKNQIDESIIPSLIEEAFTSELKELNQIEKDKLSRAACLYAVTLIQSYSIPSEAFVDIIKLINRLKTIISYHCGPEYIRDFVESIENKLAKAIESDIDNLINSLELNRKTRIDNLSMLRFVDDLNVTINNLVNYFTQLDIHSELLQSFNINYKRISSFQISNKLSIIIKDTLQQINDEFKQEYINYPENIKGCANSTYALYSNVRKLSDLLSSVIPDRELFKLKVIEYGQWFKINQIPSIWLNEFHILAKEYVLNSTYKEDTQEVASTGKSMTSVVLANRLIQFCNDWTEKIDFPDAEVKHMGIVSLTQLICDCCRLFVLRLKRLLEKSNYFHGKLSLSRSYSDSLVKMAKICICINDINHLKTINLLTLPSQLNYDLIIDELANQLNEDTLGFVLKTNLDQIISETIKDIDMLTVEILDKMTASSLHPKVLAYYTKNNCILIDYFRRNVCLAKRKIPYMYDTFLNSLWKYCVDHMFELLPEDESPIYYLNVIRDLTTIQEFFNENKLSQESIKLKTHEKLSKLKNRLEIYSKSNSQLISEYLESLDYGEPIESDNQMDNNYGTLFFKIGYENENTETCRIIIKIISCKNIPILDRINRSSDPYVKIEFLPNEYYDGIGQTKTIYKNLNPFFDEYFEFDKFPSEYMNRKDICIRLSVWDEDLMSRDDFAGEIFYPLSYIENMDKIYSIDYMKMIKCNLKRPTRSHLLKIKELERRIGFDEEAKRLYLERLELIQLSSCDCENEKECKTLLVNTALNTWNKITQCLAIK